MAGLADNVLLDNDTWTWEYFMSGARRVATSGTMHLHPETIEVVMQSHSAWRIPSA